MYVRFSSFFKFENHFPKEATNLNVYDLVKWQTKYSMDLLSC